MIMLSQKKSEGSKQQSSREMRLYLREISSIPLLTIQEEKDLGLRIQKGDREALQKLVESNLRFVIKISKKYRGYKLSFLDLINEGNLGLIEAAKRFDPSRNVRFTSYAVWWIRQAILHAITNLGHPMRLPAKISNTLYRVGNTIARKTIELRRKPTLHEIAEEVGIKIEELASMLELAGDATSLNHPIHEEGELVLGDLLASGPTLEEGVTLQFLKEHVSEALDHLDPNERMVLRLRFGLDQGVSQTLKEIGDQMHLSRERIRQIEARALEKLRQSRKSKTLASYLN